MAVCYDCMAERADGKLKRWHFRTISEQCERCGRQYSHRLIFDDD